MLKSGVGGDAQLIRLALQVAKGNAVSQFRHFLAARLGVCLSLGSAIYKETSMILRHYLGMAVVSAALLGITACDRSVETTGSNTPAPTNTARETDRTSTVTTPADNTNTAAN